MDVATSLRSSAEEPVKRTVRLESHENFSQLIFSASLVKLGPRKGMFLDIADVVERKTMRVFRDWLSQQNQLREGRLKRQESDLNDVDDEIDANVEDRELVWVDEEKKIARLKIEVKEMRWRKDSPILVMRDEDLAVSYSLEIKGTLSRPLSYQSRTDAS